MSPGVQGWWLGGLDWRLRRVGDRLGLGLGDELVKRIMMAEPLRGTSEFVEELLDRSETAVALLENMEAE